MEEAIVHRLDVTQHQPELPSLYALRFSPNGHILAISGRSPSFWTYHIPSRQFSQSFRGHTSWVRALAFSADGATLISAGADGTLRTWDASSGKSLEILAKSDTPFYACHSSQQGLVSASGDTSAFFLEGEWFAPKWCQETLRQVTFSPDGRLLAVGDRAGDIELWRCGHRSFQAALTSPGTGKLTALAFSPDSQLLAVSYSQRIDLWQVPSKRLLGSFLGHQAKIRNLVFSQDGRFLVSGGRDRVLRIWDLEKRALHGVLDGHLDRVRSLAMSSDGELLASADVKGQVLLWDWERALVLGSTSFGEQEQMVLGDWRDAADFAALATDELERLKKNLEKGPFRTQIRMIRKLAELGAHAASLLPVLLELFQNGSTALQRAIARALPSLGKEARAFLPILFETLHEKAHLVPPSYLSEEEISVAFELTSSEAQKLRKLKYSLARAVVALQPSSSEDIGHLRHLLFDPDPVFQQIIVEALGGAGELGAVALESMKELYDQNHTMLVVRLQQQRALWEKGMPCPFDLQRALVNAWGEIGPSASSVVSRLITAIQYWWVRGEALQALSQMGTDAVEPLFELLETSDFSGMELVARTIGKMGKNAAGALPLFLEALEHPKIFIQVEVIHALGEMGEPAKIALPQLFHKIESPRRSIQQAAIHTIGKLGLTEDECSKERLERLLGVLQDSNSIKTKEAVLLTLEGLPKLGQPLKNHLLRLLESNNERVRWLSARALGHSGHLAKLADLIDMGQQRVYAPDVYLFLALASQGLPTLVLHQFICESVLYTLPDIPTSKRIKQLMKGLLDIRRMQLQNQASAHLFRYHLDKVQPQLMKMEREPSTRKRLQRLLSLLSTELSSNKIRKETFAFFEATLLDAKEKQEGETNAVFEQTTEWLKFRLCELLQQYMYTQETMEDWQGHLEDALFYTS